MGWTTNWYRSPRRRTSLRKIARSFGYADSNDGIFSHRYAGDGKVVSTLQCGLPIDDGADKDRVIFTSSSPVEIGS